ncbi:MAG: iron ABC transporter permease [Desulfosalsimonadaceae bacterium]
MAHLCRKMIATSAAMLLVLIGVMVLGLVLGSAERGAISFLKALVNPGEADSLLSTIIWQIRFPRVIVAALVGATLSLGGLVFQALLRNPLAEPYILGISGGAAIGAIIGILLGFSRFFGVSLLAFSGGMATLVLVLFIAAGRTLLKKEALLLSGVMVNAFCSAVIMFLISLTQDARIHNIMFWLMGDLSSAGKGEAIMIAVMVTPCFLLVFWLSNSMNLMLMGREMAHSMGVNVRVVYVALLIISSFMVSATVSHCGLVAFVGLVIPHLFRLLLGADHRVLVPACLFGGASYLVLCDLLARTLPQHGEMPAGVITAMVGAPVFIFLLRRTG